MQVLLYLSHRILGHKKKILVSFFFTVHLLFATSSFLKCMGQQKPNPAQVSFNGHGVLYLSVWGMDVVLETWSSMFQV